jgi:thiol:disulfide interchange protein
MSNPNLIRFRLNTNKLQNYAYFDPLSRLHLTLNKKYAQIPVKLINTNIVNAIKNLTIVDIDKRIDLNTGKVIEVESNEKTEEDTKAKVKEDTKVNEEEKQEEEKTVTKKKTSKKK